MTSPNQIVEDSARELLLVGRVARAHGNRGQVIVNPETDFADDRFRVGRVLLVGPSDHRHPGASPRCGFIRAGQSWHSKASTR